MDPVVVAFGTAFLGRGDTEAAVAELRMALEIYQRIGAAEAALLAADLANPSSE